ncbi:MAG TPA: flagellar hook capping FlgD N-terminal domain-containing protein [Lacipirellulaceae bacterium]|nr:flagellar hook capping FlgD N-terminal domain-containing protein [Lacipirellulaceae bacterium]
MAILPPINTTTNNQSSTSSSTSPSTADAINDLDMSSFLKLMITELQQQDPLNPMDNKDMLDQIAQIRAVGASDQLTKTLNSVLLGQNITSATNLIGADITALTDDGQQISGVVSHIAIDQGVPKLHIENDPGLAPSSADGNMAAGTYSYRVVWDDGQQGMLGMDFSGDKAITTTGTAGVDRSVVVNGLPVTSVTKYVYRTDSTGTGPYQLVGIITDGTKGSFVDNTADKDRNGQTLSQPFESVALTQREYDVSLNNVGTIRPPGF